MKNYLLLCFLLVLWPVGPLWADLDQPDCGLDNGYLKIGKKWSDGDTVSLRFDMPIERLYSHPEVRMNSGKVALKRGPLLYCLEEADNGPNIPALSLSRNTVLTADFDSSLLGGVSVIKGEALKDDTLKPVGTLYGPAPSRKRHDLVAIPYFAWANRGRGEMSVWLKE